MKRFIALTLALCFLLAACSSPPTGAEQTGDKSAVSVQAPPFDVTYEITGTEYTQLFKVTPSEFLDTFNELVGEELALDYLHPYTDDDRSCSLTNNGETWVIWLDVLPSDEPGFSAEEIKKFTGLTKDITLSTSAHNDEDAEANGIYLRALITMFTPGGETFVEDSLGIYGEPDERAVISDGFTMLKMENVLYTYDEEDHKFTIRPAAEDGWYEEEPEQTTIIRPD